MDLVGSGFERSRKEDEKTSNGLLFKSSLRQGRFRRLLE